MQYCSTQLVGRPHNCATNLGAEVRVGDLPDGNCRPQVQQPRQKAYSLWRTKLPNLRGTQGREDRRSALCCRQECDHPTVSPDKQAVRFLDVPNKPDFELVVKRAVRPGGSSTGFAEHQCVIDGCQDFPPIKIRVH